MKQDELAQVILDLFEEVTTERTTELKTEGFSSAYNALLKFFLKMVHKGKFRRPYDVDSESGRMVFVTKGGKKIVVNDMKIGVTVFKTWKGKKDKDFFDYGDHEGILKFAQAG
tara:strand:+ start:689 stop:1027 length:339 start_codon:yes stop_codon:yes gene_type:complete